MDDRPFSSEGSDADGVPAQATQVAPLAPPPATAEPATQFVPPPARQGCFGRTFSRLLQALWFGSAAFLMIAAAAAFRAASSPTEAADVVGALLTRWHYISLFAPLTLMMLEWRRSRPVILLLLFLGVVTASGGAILDTRIRSIRLESPFPMSERSREDPIRRQFGLLHGLSSAMLLLELLLAGAVIAIDDDRPEV